MLGLKFPLATKIPLILYKGLSSATRPSANCTCKVELVTDLEAEQSVNS